MQFHNLHSENITPMIFFFLFFFFFMVIIYKQWYSPVVLGCVIEGVGVDVSADSVGATEDAFLVAGPSTIFRSLTVYGPMIPLSIAVLSSKSPSSVARGVLKKSAKETITLPLLKKEKHWLSFPIYDKKKWMKSLLQTLRQSLWSFRSLFYFGRFSLPGRDKELPVISPLTKVPIIV